MNDIFRISIIKSVGDIEIGSIGRDYLVLRGRFPQRKNSYVGSTVGVKVKMLSENELKRNLTILTKNVTVI